MDEIVDYTLCDDMIKFERFLGRELLYTLSGALIEPTQESMQAKRLKGIRAKN